MSAIFNADERGNWGYLPICKHRSDQSHIVLHLKLMRVPFGWRPLARLIRPVLNVLGVFRYQDSYDHTCIFADIKCKQCGKQTVYTLEFEKNGPMIRRGYYMHGARQSDQVVCKKSWEVQWSQVVKRYNQVAETMDGYSITSNNCQDFTRELWPKVKNYARSCR